MLTISQLFIYPVKSLGGIAIQQAEVTDRGLKHDRRWMLIDQDNRFLSQRSHPQMAMFNLSAAPNGFKVTYLPDNTYVFIAHEPPAGQIINVSVWDDATTAVLVSADIDQWFSEKLNIACRLVYMPDDALRRVDERYAANSEVVSFADGYPLLLIGQASFDELNKKVGDDVPVDRFRPNIVFTGAGAHYEDRMAEFTINNIRFYGVKPCARCAMIGIDQQTGKTFKEPAKTLAGYRTKNNKIYFGQNLLHQGEGTLNVGDIILNTVTKSDFLM